MSTTFLAVVNRAEASLAVAVNDVATSWEVTSGSGDKFPSLYPFHITCADEIVSCTNRSGDVLTVVRAQQDTIAASHSQGAKVELRITAKSISDLNTAVNTLESAGGGQAFPVGAVFLSVVSTNPNTLLGYGTWSQIAQGQFLVGQYGSDADFDVAEETGGAKTHTLTQAEMPVHTHIQDQHRHQNLRERSATTGSASTQIARTADTSSTIDTAVYTEYTTPTNQNAGSGSAHNNLPPYLVVYIWKRTA